MEVLCPVCDQHITIPSSRKVVPPPPPSAPVRPVPAPPRQDASKSQANSSSSDAKPKSRPVTPPPLESAKDRSAASSTTVKQTPKPKPKPETDSTTPTSVKRDEPVRGEAKSARPKDFPKPIPEPKKLKEQQVGSPAQPPGPPPLKKKSAAESGGVAPRSPQAETEKRPSAVKSEPDKQPASPHKKSESVDSSGEQRPKPVHPPSPPPLKSDSTAPSAGQPSPIAPAKAAATSLRPEPPPPAQQQSAPVEEAPKEVVRGVEHDPGKRWTVYQLGGSLAVLGLIGMYPEVMEVVRHFRDFESRGIESWAFFVFLMSGIQLVYALYMVQLPDWSTTRVVTVISSILSVLYATSMGVALMASEDNAIIAGLGLTPLHTAGYVSMWCCMMTMLMSLLTYFLVRASLRWQRAYELATAGR